MSDSVILGWQVQTVLQEHTKQAEVILLVYRGGKRLAFVLESVTFQTK